MEKKNLPSAENVKYAHMIVGDYSLNRRESWKHQLIKHCVNIYSDKTGDVHTWPVWLYISFHIISQTTRPSEKRYWTQNVWFSFSLKFWSQTFLILRRSERNIIINVRTSPCKVLIFLVRLHLNLNFFDRFSKNDQISNVIKIRPVGAENFVRTDGRTDRQTDMTKLIVTYGNFVNAPKNACIFVCIF